MCLACRVRLDVESSGAGYFVQLESPSLQSALPGDQEAIRLSNIAKADLRLKKDRILNIRRLINLSPICKVLSDIVRPAESEFEKLERQYCTVEIAGHRIVKEFTTPDSR